MKRHRERTQHHELLAGIIASTIANHSFAPPKSPLAPAVFMPSQWKHQSSKREKRDADRQALANTIRTLFDAQIQRQEGQHGGR